MTRLFSIGLVIAIFARFTSADELRILPSSVSLATPQSRQTLVAQWARGDRFTAQAVDAKFTSSDEKVVRIEEGVALPISDGKATITATLGDAKAIVEVTVSGQDDPFQWSFRNHVSS